MVTMEGSEHIECCHRHGTEFLAQHGCPVCLEDRLRFTRLIVKRECAILAGTHVTTAGQFKPEVGYMSRALPCDKESTVNA